LIGEVKPDFDPGELREKINEVLKEEKEKHNKEYTLHMSVGYFKYTPEIHSVAEFVSAADKYLYKQKSDRLLKRSQKEQGDVTSEEFEVKSDKKAEKKVARKVEKILTKKEDKNKEII
jgi:GGDEF domain-containing protein